MHGVCVDGRQADRSEVVREVVGGVELAVLGAVSAALLVRGAPGEETGYVCMYSSVSELSVFNHARCSVYPLVPTV